MRHFYAVYSNVTALNSGKAGFITNNVPIARFTLPYKDPRTRIIKFDLGPTVLGQIYDPRSQVFIR